MKKQTKSGKIVKRIFDIFFYVLAAFLLVTLVYTLVQKYNGKDNVSVFGYKIMVVVSSSMSYKHPDYTDFLEGHDNQLLINDLIIVKELKNADSLDMYSVVTFVDSKGRTVIHRIVEQAETNGVTYYRTRGDATNSLDARRTASQYNGILAANLGQIGVFVRFLQSRYGVAAVAACLLVVLTITLLTGKKKEKVIEPPDEE